jgi:hypothetical protein
MVARFQADVEKLPSYRMDKTNNRWLEQFSDLILAKAIKDYVNKENYAPIGKLLGYNTGVDIQRFLKQGILTEDEWRLITKNVRIEVYG